MNDGSGSTRISLRLADGEYFPIFSHGDPDTRNLSLVPATRNQDEADIQFYYHPGDGTTPVPIGMVKFPNLPSGTEGSEDTELHLDAVIGGDGVLAVAVRHRDSGRLERLEMELPDNTGASRSGSAGRSGSWRRKVVGLLFVALSLAVILWLTLLVTNWGKQDVPEAPLSTLILDTGEV